MRAWHNVIKYSAIVLAVLLVVGVFAGIVRLLSFFLPGFNLGNTGEWKTYEIENEIGVLDVDIHQIDLEIMTSSDSKFKVESNYKHLTVSEQENKLLIKDERNFFFFNVSGKAVLKLYVPEDTVFDKLDIKTGAGTADLENLRAKTIEMDFGAGKATLMNVFVNDHAFLDTGAGKISIKDSQFNNLDLDMGVGNFEFSGLLLGKNVLRMGVGSSQIDLTGSLDDYEISIEKGLGDVRVGQDKVGNGERLGKGDREISLKGGVGSIQIDFSE
ncbi:MAG TPA: DUF4097 domain-containing protein [Clostridiaceae bacterium]|jgi:DUF4097 and DUF4098 domain-containing protein YvlB|nr:DUF4097 domain-containing protein [Clostridiaceae bacterium]